MSFRPEYLNASANYNFGSRSVDLRFFTEDFDWKLIYINGCYNFHKINLSREEFVEVASSSYLKEKLFRLNTNRIDRHILMKQFTVKISYQFSDDVDGRIYNTSYSFNVSCRKFEALHSKSLRRIVLRCRTSSEKHDWYSNFSISFTPTRESRSCLTTISSIMPTCLWT